MEPTMWNAEQSPKPSPQSPNQPPASARQSDERRVVAWVGKSVIFKGDLISSEDLTIDGHVEGSISLKDHSLTIGPDADIRANIVARTVTVHGSVTGKIDARDKVDLRETGSVLGDINSPRLAIADGAMLRGRVDTEVGEGEKDKKERKGPVTAH
jgi:cytoskeletal protein CcmA (bactofilin family)